ncbi:MAG: PstS family phosphate ABC transporter substrate-binding protein [Planctomycetes bacterium]|nr:PstS family phosphate ABC transporter substrate-binding protein [Planctomycetota bacterium]
MPHHPSYRRRRGLTLAYAAAALWIGTSSAIAQTAIVITGSDRMAPFLRELAKAFQELHPDVSIDVQGGGSGVGIKALESGAAAIAALDRPATSEEIRRFRLATKHAPVGVPIALDAVILFVHPANHLTSLSLEQIGRIYTHRITNWDQLDVSPGQAAPPKQTANDRQGRPADTFIKRHIPPATSGLLDVLRSRAMAGKAFTTDTVEHPSADEVARAVSVNRLALGIGRAGASKGVKVLAIRRADGSDAIIPTPDTIRSRTYPLSHYLYLYFPAEPEGAAKDFMLFTINPVGQRIIGESSPGAVPLPFDTGQSE